MTENAEVKIRVNLNPPKRSGTLRIQVFAIAIFLRIKTVEQELLNIAR